ncbi:hypothetical protein F383_37353 [Gossypium arboreum]|uniref:Uncharacterized protein n=1 Tax=Gossypium arboreum TaxID=29729 RepID=A0A0B0MF66_GOSAR|nr:hypothetical protein F383_37353 [Gossypium arboreum]
MFRSRTKEIRFGSGKNKSCRLAAPFHFTSSKILELSYELVDCQQSSSNYLLFLCLYKLNSNYGMYRLVYVL